jgi:NAD(P)-dependent dehydrogenase (short-subunit alcohol dehydrogenase family)
MMKSAAAPLVRRAVRRLFAVMNSSACIGTLSGKVTVVTGASRGAGRGIAVTLGEAGATVYVTGRSVKGQATTENLLGTIEETAEIVTARGGTGIAVRCDHTIDSDVEDLFGRVQREQGRIDLLVNNAWGGYEHHEPQRFSAPFYEQPLRHWKECSPRACARL